MWFQKERRVEVCVFRGGRLGYDCGLRRRSLLKRGRARSNGSSVFVQREEGGRAGGAPPRHHSHPSPQHGAGDVGLIKQHEQHKGTRAREVWLSCFNSMHHSSAGKNFIFNPIFFKLILLKSRLKVWLPKIWRHKLSFDWMCHIYVPHKELLSIYCNQQLKSCSGLITFSFTLMIYHFKNAPLRCHFPFLIQIYIRLKKTILCCERLLSH